MKSGTYEELDKLITKIVMEGKVTGFVAYPSSIRNETDIFAEERPYSDQYQGLYHRFKSVLLTKSPPELRAHNDNKTCFRVEMGGDTFWVGFKDWIITIGGRVLPWDGQEIRTVGAPV